MVSFIHSIDTGHDDMIHDAQMDYYGVHLATCSTDRCVRIFDVRNGQHILVATLKEHQGPVWQLAWAHPMYGSLLASCGYDKRVIIWKEINGQWTKIYEYNNFESSVNSVCWAPYEYGLILAAGSSDRSIAIISSSGDGVWEDKKINNAHAISCNAVSWAPAVQAGSLLEPSSVKLPGKRFVSGGADYLVKIWKEENGQWVEEEKLENHSDWVRDVAWAPSIGLPRNIIASCSQDKCVYIWMNDGTNTTWSSKLLHEFSDVVWHLSWSVTGNILAVSGGDNKVSLWKENLEGAWTCISNVVKGQGEINNNR